MSRFKDREWNLPDQIQWAQVPVAVLMDIRDELRAVRRALDPLHRLNCPDFLRIPRTLGAIKTNTTKAKRKPKNGGTK